MFRRLVISAMAVVMVLAVAGCNNSSLGGASNSAKTEEPVELVLGDTTLYIDSSEAAFDTLAKEIGFEWDETNRYWIADAPGYPDVAIVLKKGYKDSIIDTASYSFAFVDYDGFYKEISFRISTKKPYSGHPDLLQVMYDIRQNPENFEDILGYRKRYSTESSTHYWYYHVRPQFLEQSVAGLGFTSLSNIPRGRTMLGQREILVHEATDLEYYVSEVMAYTIEETIEDNDKSIMTAFLSDLTTVDGLYVRIKYSKEKIITANGSAKYGFFRLKAELLDEDKNVISSISSDDESVMACLKTYYEDGKITIAFKIGMLETLCEAINDPMHTFEIIQEKFPEISFSETEQNLLQVETQTGCNCENCGEVE